jgi:hypothetical protein
MLISGYFTQLIDRPGWLIVLDGRIKITNVIQVLISVTLQRNSCIELDGGLYDEDVQIENPTTPAGNKSL